VEQSLVHLLARKTNQPVEAELWDDIATSHVEQWRKQWLPRIEETRELLENKEVPKEEWPQDLHWDWDKKTDWSRKYLSLRRFAITCGGNLQGLMLINLTKLTARIESQKGKDLAYVEFISTAPWNRPQFENEPVFGGVGSTLVRVAVEVSKDEGFRGRIGLHSLKQSAEFYRTKCGMTDLGLDPTYHGLAYFEMTEGQAKTFCA
jgi:hypothetical protein